MSDPSPLILFLILVITLLSGFPVAFTIGGVSLYLGYLTFGLDFFNLLPLRIWGIMSNYVLIAVPLFVYMGVMLERSGLAEDLLQTMGLLFRGLRGGLAVSVVIVGALLAASTGIVGATVVTMGLLSLPTMIKWGYNPAFATGTIAASGTLGQIIPPSIILVLLGSVLNVSVGDLFMGAVIPGFLLVVSYLLWIFIFSHLNPSSAPTLPEGLSEVRGWALVRDMAKALVPPLFLILAVLGSIFLGVASPTEAAAVGALGATILTALHRRLSLGILREVMRETTHLTCMVFTILVGATAFSLVFRGMDGDLYLRDLVIEGDMGANLFLFIVMAVIFLAGFFIDFIEIIFIIVPIVEPVLKGMGVDPLWVGVLIALNLQTSFLTPPFGFALFYLKGTAPPGVRTSHIYRGIIPFVIIQIIVLLIVSLFPETVTWLPAHMGG